MNAYYNEHDPFAAAWLRRLIDAGAITPGVVDERDIQLVQPSDLRGFTRCHFFAGIGGWDHALNLAGWGDRPVWTGSCPCQPFSSAGKGEGFNDPRHLWPSWFRLIRECRPPTVFGEQVASADGLAWFDTVSTDLEAEAYAIGATDLCAASVGAPHIRQRLFFVADANAGGSQVGRAGGARDVERGHRSREASTDHRDSAAESGDSGTLADAQHSERRPLSLDGQDGRDGPDGGRQEAHGELGARSQVRVVGNSEGEGSQGQRGVCGASVRHEHRGLAGLPGPDGLGNATSERRGEARGHRAGPEEWPAGAGRLADPESGGAPADQQRGRLREPERESPWADLIWLPCRDGKARPTKPGIQPLAYGVRNRVGTLRGAGNAIVPQVAAEFIGAFLDV